MLEPIKHILSHRHIILASTSPRRREILNLIGLKYEVVASNFEEKLDKETFSHPCEYVKENAKQKALDVYRRCVNSGDFGDIIIGADTVVTFDGNIYEKPTDKENAFEILKKLSGKKHTVFTGVALITAANTEDGNEKHFHRTHSTQQLQQQHHHHQAAAAGGAAEHDQYSENSENNFLVTTFHEATDVIMCEMSDAIIRSYIATGEPMDKAGAYAVQGIGATLIEGIRGDYYNVMGFPVHRFCRELYHMYTD